MELTKDQIIELIKDCIVEWEVGRSKIYLDFDEFIEHYVKPKLDEMRR